MSNLVTVRFRDSNKHFEYEAREGSDLREKDFCIVETERGVDIAIVLRPPYTGEFQVQGKTLRRVVRRAGKDDFCSMKENCKKEREAFKTCLEKIKLRNLPMKLVSVRYTLDRKKLTFYFTADGRIDFRELVKDLAAIFKTRIELLQIGVRDESRMKGGLGPCGLGLCCSSYITEFGSVTIKMAKEQNMILNPIKISGVCGKLMCCLAYEQNIYEDFKRHAPQVGTKVVYTDNETYEVIGLNPLHKTVKIRMENGYEKEVSLDEIKK